MRRPKPPPTPPSPRKDRHRALYRAGCLANHIASNALKAQNPQRRNLFMRELENEITQMKDALAMANGIQTPDGLAVLPETSGADDMLKAVRAAKDGDPTALMTLHNAASSACKWIRSVQEGASRKRFLLLTMHPWKIRDQVDLLAEPVAPGLTIVKREHASEPDKEGA